jgi:hypothetical protein
MDKINIDADGLGLIELVECVNRVKVGDCFNIQLARKSKDGTFINNNSYLKALGVDIFHKLNKRLKLNKVISMNDKYYIVECSLLDS